MLEYIKNNPYRILGVYANGAKKKWVENSLALLESLKNDNSLTFPMDWTEVLGPIHRNLNNVRDAAYVLENKEIRELESLFWVQSQGLDSFVSNLGNEKDIEMGVKSYEKALNSALIAIGKGNTIKAFYRYKIAFQCNSPSSKVLVLFFERIIKVYLRENPTGDVNGVLNSIFGEDYRMELQEAMQSFVPSTTGKTEAKTECNNNKTNEAKPKSKFSKKSASKIKLNWNKIYMYVIQPWLQFNGWTVLTIIMLIVIIVLIFKMI